MANCPHSHQHITLTEITKETAEAGFLKPEIMYSCPHCNMILGFSRGNYR